MVAGGNVFVTAGCDIVAKLHRKALHVGDDDVAEVKI